MGKGTPAEHERAAADLRWFWMEAHGDLGLRSNFNAVVSLIEGASPSGRAGEPQVHVLEAAARARHISRTLEAVTPHMVRILRLAFGGSDDRLRTLAIATMECADAHRRSRSLRPVAEWFDRLSAAARKGDDLERKRAWVKIQASAQQALSRALEAYVGARDAQS